MNDNATDSALGSQGNQDFSALVSGQPNPTPTPSSTPTPSPTPASSSNGGGNRGVVPGVPDITPPAPTSRPAGPGGDAPAPGAVPSADNTAPGAPGVPGPGAQPVAPGTQPNQNDVVGAAVEAAIRATREQQSAPAGQPQPKQLTDQEFNAKYRVVSVTPQHMTAILDQDPVKAAASMNQLIQGAVTQALLMSADIAAAEAAKVRDEFSPHINSWQSHQKSIREKEAETQFYTAYPQLNEERALVNEIKDAYIARVRSGQVKFTTPQEAFAAVANTATNMLIKFGKLSPTGQPLAGVAGSNGSSTPSPGQPPARQMSAASSAGRTGTGQPAAAQTTVDAVFGADAR